jgi:DNA-directed RNA polymerase beta' subunit
MELSGIRVAFYTEDEIRKLCVAKVTNAATYDRGIPRLEGLNDPRLGISHQTTRCPTCNEIHCDQHMGYVELARPVYRLGAINYVIQILRCVCRACASPKYDDISPFQNYSPKDKLRAVSDLCKTKYICQVCKEPQPNYSRKDRTFIETSYREKDLLGITDPEHKAHLLAKFEPEEARAILEALSDKIKTDLNLFHPEEMVARLQLIPPPCIRPSNFVGDSKVRSENDLTVALQDLVKASLDTAVDPRNYTKLQVMQAGLVNHTIKKTVGAKLGVVPNLVVSNKRKVIDLKTRLSGKKGRFRGNLSGKRVDQSGRSVVGPDCSHDITELGVPSTMMNTFTFPERVTSFNKQMLAKSIMTGAYKDNGAMAVQQGSSLIWLPILDLDARLDLAAQLKPGDIVERHLKDGDWVIFNRQPSLWKASMMAFTIYRTNTLCFRLPLPVTKPFNADFDGDEMNVHSLQGYEAIAEAQELLSVPNQILNPQSNSVIVGLVQDSLVGGYLLSSKNTFLRPDQFQKLCMCRDYDPTDEETYALMGHKSWGTIMPKPAILKSPKGAWYTGKQAISYLLPKVRFDKKVRTEDLWTDDIVNVNSELLSGQLCKSTLGATNQGLLQAIHRKYGSWATCKFISDAQRLFVQFLSWAGPSISILDCVTPRPKDIIAESLVKANNLLALDLPSEIIEAKSSSVLQETLRTVGSSVVGHLSKASGLSCVVTSGSKGNLMNIAQIAGCVGQQTVFGRRIPMRNTPSGKRTLAYFDSNDKSPKSRGFIESSYMSGLKPHEFFYHQMAGREGIVATAVNTADSGYNQRRMIKSQESQCIAYDGTVRVSGHFVVQESYGYDDLDGSKIVRSRMSLDLLESARSSPFLVIQDAAKHVMAYLAQQVLFVKELDTTVVCPITADLFTEPLGPGFFDAMKDLLVGIHATLHRAKSWHTPIPVSVALLLAFSKRRSCDLEALRKAYSEGLVQPGESVGALAATSIGEPSMQMTLNVFHYTGIASKNVTITGLPRFRQLINAVDTYETANMSAEVSFETAPSGIHSVHLSMVADCTVHHLAASFADRLLTSIPLVPGPMAQKFGKKKQDLTFSQFKICVSLRWDDAERNQITLFDVANGIRKVLGPEVSVMFGPNSSNLLWVYPIGLGNRQYIEALCESMQSLQVKGIPGVKRSLVLQEQKFTSSLQKKSVFCLDTEGSSLLELCKVPNIDIETAVTNNVLEVASVLGITAAVHVLQAELHKVLSFDSSYVDPRHTRLLADTMCRTGSVCAMNRHNMENLGNSILQRASFEQSLEIFHEGAVFGRFDTLSGATERIMVGQPANVGTGIVSLVTETPKGSTAGGFIQRLKDSEGSEMYIRPLDTTFSLDVFSLRIPEEPRDGISQTYIDFFARWRSFAGLHHYAAQVSTTQVLSRGHFLKTLSECKRLGTWTKKQTFCATIVRYTHSGRLYETSITDTFQRSHCVLEQIEETGPFKLFVKKETTSVPVSVIPESVSIVHQSLFWKTGFVLTFQEEWKKETQEAAEAAILSEVPVVSYTVAFEDPEQMLQVRATNAQFASAFLSRQLNMPLASALAIPCSEEESVGKPSRE